MYRKYGVLALAGGLLLASPAAAQQQLQCSQRTLVLTTLSDKYEEKPVAMGLASNGGVLEVLSNGEGSTWTIIVTMPNGMSCMVAAGENWEQIQQTSLGPSF
jgi:hypothetical protein